MDDGCEEQQLQEIEALESMYSNELNVICRTYPNISAEIEVRIESAEFEELFGKDTAILRTTLPAEYPNCAPKIDLPDFDGDSEGREHSLPGLREMLETEVREELKRVAEESIGMPMVFSLVSGFQESLAQIFENYLKNKEELERKRIEQKEKEELARFEGNRVSVESFNNWNKAFLEEVRAKKAKEAKNQDSQKVNRLTGRQLFLADRSLDISDLQFLENHKEGSVEIDQSLFEEELDLESDEDDEDYVPEEEEE